jgi:hypothetical protein
LPNEKFLVEVELYAGGLDSLGCKEKDIEFAASGSWRQDFQAEVLGAPSQRIALTIPGARDSSILFEW